MDTSGTHVLVEYWECLSISEMSDVDYIRNALLDGTRAANATPISNHFHKFSPSGVSGVVVIEESHFSIHTWPEHGYAAVDFYTCGECIPEKAISVVGDWLKSKDIKTIVVKRGNRNGMVLTDETQ